jgi:hypothetical protein
MRMRLITLLAFAGLFMTALAAWGPEVGITNNRLENVTYHANVHKVVYDRSGVGHLVWYDQVGEAVYYKRYWPGSGWSKDLSLAKTADWAYPAIALDSNGTTIHVVWRMWKHVGSTNFHIYYWKCNPTGPGTGGWVGNAMDLDENVGAHDRGFPSIACGRSGQVVVTWQEQWGYPNWVYSIGFREYANGAWKSQTLIGDPSPHYRSYPTIASAGNGDLSVACMGSLTDQANPHVLVTRRIGAAPWTGWEDATAGLPTGYFLIPDIEVNPITKNPHIVCHDYETVVNGVDTAHYYHIYHSYHTDAAGWIGPELVSPPDVTGEYQASMFFDVNGTAHVVWHGRDASITYGGIKYASCPGDGGTWTEPYWLTTNVSGIHDNAPNITVQADGSLHVVWTRQNSTSRYPYQIFGASSSGSFGPMAGSTVPPRGFALDVSPNPASRRMVVSYSLPVAGNVSLKLYDARGALAKTLACGYVLPGNHALSLDRQGLVRGAYILKLESGASSSTRKLIIE